NAPAGTAPATSSVAAVRSDTPYVLVARRLRDRGHARAGRSELREALRDLEAAVALDPTDARAQGELAWLLLEYASVTLPLRRLALERAHAALRLDPNNADALLVELQLGAEAGSSSFDEMFGRLERAAPGDGRTRALLAVTHSMTDAE